MPKDSLPCNQSHSPTWSFANNENRFVTFTLFQVLEVFLNYPFWSPKRLNSLFLISITFFILLKTHKTTTVSLGDMELMKQGLSQAPILPTLT